MEKCAQCAQLLRETSVVLRAPAFEQVAGIGYVYEQIQQHLEAMDAKPKPIEAPEKQFTGLDMSELPNSMKDQLEATPENPPQADAEATARETDGTTQFRCSGSDRCCVGGCIISTRLRGKPTRCPFGSYGEFCDWTRQTPVKARETHSDPATPALWTAADEFGKLIWHGEGFAESAAAVRDKLLAVLKSCRACEGPSGWAKQCETCVQCLTCESKDYHKDKRCLYLRRCSDAS